MLQFTRQPTNLSQSGLQEPLLVELGQKDGFEGQRLRRRVSRSLVLSKSIPGFINYKTAECLALRTIDSHERLLNKWLEHIGDQEIGKINAQDVVVYLSWLRNGYTPHRYNGKTHPLSPKTLRNVWVTLSSFYSWAAQELGVAQIMKAVPAPRAEETPIEPLNQEGVQRMLKVCVYSREAHPSIVEASSCA